MWLCLNVIWHSLLLMGWVSALLPPKQHIRVCLGRLGGDLSSLSSSQIPFSEDGLLPEVKKRSRKQEISRKWPRKRKNPRSSSSRGTDFSFLKSLESTGDIVDFIRNQDASAQVFRSWSSYDETSFIRLLRDRRAYREIIEFMSVARKNVYVYTAAISSLASSDDYKKECFRLLDDMQRLWIQPNSYTFSALFAACSDYKEVAPLIERLRSQYPKIRRTAPMWESAIYACVPQKTSQNFNRPLDSSLVWGVVERIIDDIKSEGVLFTSKIYHALFYVCAETGNLSKAMSLYASMEESVPLTPRLWGAVLQVCGRSGAPTEAFDILKSMQSKGITPNVRHCTSYLNALLAARQLHEAVRFLEHMASPNPASLDTFGGLLVESPDMIAVRTVLKAVTSKGSYEQALRLFQRIKKGDFGTNNIPDEKCYLLLLSVCQEPIQAKQVIREMQLSRRHRIGSVPPSLFAYTRAVTTCRRTKDVESARFFLASARSNGVVPDVYMYTAAIWAAGGAGDISAAVEFLTEMQANGCSPNIVSYDGVIATFAADGNAAGALSVYDESVRRNLRATRTTFLQLAAAIRRGTSDLEERLTLLVVILEKAAIHKYSVDVLGPIFEALIATFGAQGRIDDALEVFDRIQGPTDAPCLRAITFACSVVSPPAWEEAVSIIHSSDIVGGQAPYYIDQAALGNAMLSCSKANEWEESLQLFRLYGSDQTPLMALNSLIASCGRGKRPDIAIEVLNEMESVGLKPDSISFRNAVIACNQAEHDERRPKIGELAGSDSHPESDGLPFGWWECALSLLRRMKEDGLKPDIQTYSSAISACEAAGKWQTALGILQTMMNEADDEDSAPSLNLYCFNAAIAACGKGEAWVEALDLYERMKQKGGKQLRPTVVTYGSLILALDSAGQKELAVNIYEEAVRNRAMQPWRDTWNTKGARIQAMDLHQFSASMSRAAVRSHMDNLLSGKTFSIGEDLIIIVGRGLRSEGAPVLLASVQNVLLEDYGIEATVDKQNEGRLIVNSDDIEAMISRKAW